MGARREDLILKLQREMQNNMDPQVHFGKLSAIISDNGIIYIDQLIHDGNQVSLPIVK